MMVKISVSRWIVSWLIVMLVITTINADCPDGEYVPGCIPCQTTCEDAIEEPKPCMLICRHTTDCYCKADTFRHKSGRCVTKDNCRDSENDENLLTFWWTIRFRKLQKILKVWTLGAKKYFYLKFKLLEEINFFSTLFLFTWFESIFKTNFHF